MRRPLIGWLFILHGLAHSALGFWAASLGPAWVVTPLWWIAQVGFVAAGAAIVVEHWGAFVLELVDATTTKLHIRLRGEGTPTVASSLLAPVSLLVFEPAHFIMERGMMLGIKRRAEGSAG